MLLSQVKASTLLALESMARQDLPAVNAAKQSYWERQQLVVEHRGCTYWLGHWDDWNGPFWMVEVSTGIIYRGTLTDVKAFLVLCSAVSKGDE